jgi:hypothetical protein
MIAWTITKHGWVKRIVKKSTPWIDALTFTGKSIPDLVTLMMKGGQS